MGMWVQAGEGIAHRQRVERRGGGGPLRLCTSGNTLVGSGCGPKSSLLPPASVQAQRDIIRTNSARTKPRFPVCSLDPTKGGANILALGWREFSQG